VFAICVFCACGMIVDRESTTPTLTLASAAVVVCCFLLLFSVLIQLCACVLCVMFSELSVCLLWQWYEGCFANVVCWCVHVLGSRQPAPVMSCTVLCCVVLCCVVLYYSSASAHCHCVTVHISCIDSDGVLLPHVKIQEVGATQCRPM
jgi:hypothetical protein